MTTVNLQEVFFAAKTLSRNDQLTLRDMINEHVAREARRTFRPGDKVKFETRRGYMAEGTVKSVGPKNIKVMANADKYGSTSYPVTWTCSPQLLESVT